MIYLDHAASTPCDPSVVDAMLPWFIGEHANAASPHAAGKRATGDVRQARGDLASVLGVEPSRVVFTSGATEALNAALTGVASLATGDRRRLLVSAAEHKAVLDTAGHLDATGQVDLVTVPVLDDARTDHGALAGLLDGRTLAVVAMAANNETGTLNDIRTLAAMAHDAGALYVSDTTQAVGKIPLSLSDDHVDIAAVSAHKFGGPQGIGALVVPTQRPPSGWQAHMHGGGHERGWRSGTINLPGVVGMAAAARLAQSDLEAGAERTVALRDKLESRLADALGATVHAKGAPRLPNITSVHVPGVDAEALIANASGVAFAAGSACTSAVPQPSHVLTSMGVSADVAEQTIRLSVGRSTTGEEVDCALSEIIAAAERIKDMEEHR